MSTRIKVITYEDGSKNFYPQYRSCGIWWHFKEFYYDCSMRSVHSTIEGAQKVIDKYHEIVKRNSPTQIDYVKYP